MLHFETNDYAQNSVWATFIGRVSGLKTFLGWLGRTSEIDHGGLTHRGRKRYTLESVGLLYCFLYFLLLIADLSLLMPVFRGDIAKI